GAVSGGDGWGASWLFRGRGDGSVESGLASLAERTPHLERTHSGRRGPARGGETPSRRECRGREPPRCELGRRSAQRNPRSVPIVHEVRGAGALDEQIRPIPIVSLPTRASRARDG